MSELAVMPRGDAVAEAGKSMVRTDGRNRRAAETRRKIIEAAKAMIEETSSAPTVVGVARRADVSVRSVFQHFHDVESLFVTVLDAVRSDLHAPEVIASDKPLSQRIDWIVQELAELFEKVVPLRVAAGQFVGHPALIERGLAVRQELRTATLALFAPEFAKLTEAAREELADAIGAALSLEAWIVLRRRDELTVERASAIWKLTLTALLEHGLGAGKA